MRKPDYDVRNLYAGIVNVILNVNFPSRVAQEAYKRVAQDRVAQMSNMCSFVRIDARVLNQNFAVRSVGWRLSIGNERLRHPRAVDLHVQVAGWGDLHLGDAIDGSDVAFDRFGDLQRRRAQRLG